MATCLIVDDSRIVRKVASCILQNMRYETREAVNGADALDFCRIEMPDAILLDWTMPVMNGLDFLRALRREEKGQAPKVLFCAGQNDPEFIAEALNSGADDFILKPFDSLTIQSKFSRNGLV